MIVAICRIAAMLLMPIVMALALLAVICCAIGGESSRSLRWNRR